MLSFDQTPFNRALRFELLNRGDGSASITLPIESWFLQENGVVHGGIIASVADTAAVYALIGRVEKSEQMTGVEFKINFLRSATFDGGPITARATAVRSGRTIGVCDVEVSQKEQLVAKGLFTYVFIVRPTDR
jgi:uncharacterized protein (TIGR00369 family)